MDRATGQRNQEQAAKGADQPTRSFSFLLWLPVVPLAYLLAAGPIAKLDQVYCPQISHPTAARAVQLYYEPICFLSERSSRFASCRRWYLEKDWRVRRIQFVEY